MTRRVSGFRLRLSSIVPTTKRTNAHTNRAAKREVAAPETNSATATADTTAIPPRYGVTRSCPLYPPGTSTKSVRSAMRMAIGTKTSVATRASAKAPASCSSSGNLHGLRHEAVLDVVGDDVVDRLVDGVARRPAGGRLQLRDDGLAVRDFLEARLVGL